jgi:hypothetical protein
VQAISEVTGATGVDRVVMHPGGTFENTIPIRENDACLMLLDRL